MNRRALQRTISFSLMHAVHLIGDAIDAVDAILEVMRTMQLMRWFKQLGKKTLCARCRFRGIINSSFRRTSVDYPCHALLDAIFATSERRLQAKVQRA